MSQITLQIDISEIHEQNVVNELSDYIKENLPEKTRIEREGSLILIKSKDEIINKRYLKFLVRKFVGKANIGGLNRVIATGKTSYQIIHREFESE